jgi:hypothetical protein
MGQSMGPQQFSRGTLDATLWRIYHVSRPFGWPVINDKHGNANEYIKIKPDDKRWR